MKFHNPGIVVAKLVAAVMLLGALGRQPYDYYTLLRWAVCGVATVAALRGKEAGKTRWGWAFAIVALFYNPILPVHLSRGTWGFINLGVAVFLVVSIAMLDRRKVSP